MEPTISLAPSRPILYTNLHEASSFYYGWLPWALAANECFRSIICTRMAMRGLRYGRLITTILSECIRRHILMASMEFEFFPAIQWNESAWLVDRHNGRPNDETWNDSKNFDEPSKCSILSYSSVHLFETVCLIMSLVLTLLVYLKIDWIVFGLNRHVSIIKAELTGRESKSIVI